MTEMKNRRVSDICFDEQLSFLGSVLKSTTEHSILAINLDGKILIWNEGAKQMYGYTAPEIIGKNESVIHHPENIEQGKLQSIYATVRQTGKWDGELQLVRKDGSLFTALVTITLRQSLKQIPIGYTVISRDLTESVKLLQKLKMSEEMLHAKNTELEKKILEVQKANRLKDEFLANMSHELRTPLNGIIGFTEMMYDNKVGPISAIHKEYLGDILTSSRQLLVLINDVLDVAKIESGKIEFFPVSVELDTIVYEVRDVFNSILTNKELQLSIYVDPSVNNVYIDPGKFKQILSNYLSNACKFTPRKGKIDVRILPEGSNSFRLEVQDNGIGIRKKDLTRLFLEFEQLDAGPAKSYPGTGLGLSLVRRIVEAQGGHVGVESCFKKGSTFFAVLLRHS